MCIQWQTFHQQYSLGTDFVCLIKHSTKRVFQMLEISNKSYHQHDFHQALPHDSELM